jgi:hypothetical protein
LAIDTNELFRCLERLTGEKPKRRRHNYVFRMVVRSSDGHACTIRLDANKHRREPSAANLNDLADRLRVDRGEILAVLEGWSGDRLREHLARYTAAELKPPSYRGPG